MESEGNEFRNDQINTDNLPQIATVNYKPIQRNYLYISYLSSVIFFTIILAGALVILSFSGDLLSRTTVYALIAWPLLI